MWGATPIDQLWCRIEYRRLNYSGLFTPPSLDKSLIYPGNNGIMNWGSFAVDAERQILIVIIFPIVGSFCPSQQK